MKKIIYVAIALFAIAGAAPAMAQVALPAAADATNIAHSPDTSGGQWLLLQGYGRHGEVVFQWHYIDVRRQERDVRNYHGFHTPGQ
jgi:hypothetical protein